MSSLGTYYKEKHKKLDSRSHWSIHAGYNSINLFLIYISSSGKVIIIRNIYFDETHYYNKRDLKF